MAYGVMSTKPATKFAKWLDRQMCMYNMGGQEVADALHCSLGAVSYHRTGKCHPTFSDVVAYCWLFKSKEDPESIWKMTTVPNEE